MKTISNILLWIGGTMVIVAGLFLLKSWITETEIDKVTQAYLAIMNIIGLGIATIGMIIEIYRTRRHQEAILNAMNEIMDDTDKIIKEFVEKRKEQDADKVEPTEM